MTQTPGERTVRLRGPVLVLTAAPAMISPQLSGEAAADHRELLRQPLMDDISTDEIIPGWCCYWYDRKLGDYAYLGLRGGLVTEGSVSSLAPQVIVSGYRKGCGSSREHAVYAEKYAGCEIVFARSFERIYEQNCRNVGLITCSDFDLLDALLAGAELPVTAFARDASALEATITARGGLFGLSSAERQRAATSLDAPRPRNCVEKIMQAHLPDHGARRAAGTVRAGESYFLTADIRFSHEYVTPMAGEIFSERFGEDTRLRDSDSCYFFSDHLSLAEHVLAGKRNGAELISRVRKLRSRQEEFVSRAGGHLIGSSPEGGSRAICHNYIVEHVAAPGDLIIGTDSHTCTAGAVGALAFGVGATDMAGAWQSGEVLVRAPEAVKVILSGRLRPGVCAKDLVLSLLASPAVREGRTLGKVMVYSGPGCGQLSMDERATVCNMAVEMGAMTALVEPDRVTEEYLARRGAGGRGLVHQPVTSDAGARFAEVVRVALDEVVPMVALPGDPKNSVPLTSVSDVVPVDKVYGGSCTGGKAQDMDMYASVFEIARARKMSVPGAVQAYIQMGSETVMAYAAGRGYLDLFADVGVKVLPPSCGACINAGPGASRSADEVTVSAQNRNFPGRSGPGQVYLASPYVVAATAIAGRLSSVEELFGEEGAR
jgi:3-isopropylmalate/(R)-2-methylmalate dehydratase large subunit